MTYPPKFIKKFLGNTISKKYQRELNHFISVSLVDGRIKINAVLCVVTTINGFWHDEYMMKWVTQVNSGAIVKVLCSLIKVKLEGNICGLQLKLAKYIDTKCI